MQKRGFKGSFFGLTDHLAVDQPIYFESRSKVTALRALSRGHDGFLLSTRWQIAARAQPQLLSGDKISAFQ